MILITAKCIGGGTRILMCLLVMMILHAIARHEEVRVVSLFLSHRFSADF